MIYCIIKGKEATVQHTHPNNQGIITTFLNRGIGNVSASSFCLSDFKSVEDFLKKEYGAKIINKYELARKI